MKEMFCYVSLCKIKLHNQINSRPKNHGRKVIFLLCLFIYLRFYERLHCCVFKKQMVIGLKVYLIKVRKVNPIR